MIITFFEGAEFNTTGGENSNLSFEEFAKLFEKPQKGEKKDGYFVRGELNPIRRKDVNLKSSELLVIDGDASIGDPSSAPSPAVVHDYLKQRNLSHFIYTSHSHTQYKNKFRCVIHSNLPEKKYLMPTAKKITQDLNNNGILLRYVKEMGVWSQPWFIARRDDPDDGLYEFYMHIGEKYKSVLEVSGSIYNIDGVSDDADEIDSFTYDERIKQITSGESYHDNIRGLSWGFIKDGMHPKGIIAILEGLMNSVENKDERWQSRYDDIERITLEGAAKHISDSEDASSEVYIPKIKKKTYDNKVPWPPGYLGQLARDALAMQIHQYDIVALVSALGLVAGIAGRRFNISNTGLNVYMTLIMRTGMGKDSINEFIERNLVELNDTGQSYSFLGSGRFTGPKAVYKDLKNARSQICIFTEAGLLFRNKIGDADGLTRTLLSLYTVSGQDRMSKSETFSNDDNNITSMRAPALSIINEATPETLLEAFKESGALENGLLPRQSIFRVGDAKPYPSISRSKGITTAVRDRLKELIHVCSKVQSQDNPQAWDFTFDDDVKQKVVVHSKRCVDLYNDYISSDSVKAIMSSRLHVKTLKFAAIASVLNHKDVVIREEEWDWAAKFADYEYDGIDNFFAGSSITNVMHDLAIRIVGMTINKVLHNGYKTSKKQMEIRYRKSGIISKYVLRQCLLNNAELANISDDSKSKSAPKDGLDKVLAYMSKEGYVNEVADPYGNKTALYKITPLFSAWVEAD